jgi:hypothetical protein
MRNRHEIEPTRQAFLKASLDIEYFLNSVTTMFLIG